MKRHKIGRIVAAWLVTALVIAGGITSLQAGQGQYRARPLDRQNVGHITTPFSTTSTEWTPIGNWSYSDGMLIRARGAIAATLSVTVAGAPSEFRIVMELPAKRWKLRPMKPRFARFDPHGGTNSFSYTFVAFVPPGPYTINLVARSLVGERFELKGGSLVVQYGSAE